MKGWRFPEAQQAIADRIRPRDITLLHGLIDAKKLSLPERPIVKGVKAPTGDFREWDSVAAWAGGIARALRQGAG